MTGIPRLRTLTPLLALATAWTAPASENLPRLMEHLGRGVIAVQQADGKVFVSWRLLATDPDGVAFNVYRTTAEAPGGPIDYGIYRARDDIAAGTVKLNAEPLVGPTWWLDTDPGLQRRTSYFVRAVVDGIEGDPSAPFVFEPDAEPLPYVAIPMHAPDGYLPGEASVGDLDGDGEYELVVKLEKNPQDNSHSGITGEPRLQAYRLQARDAGPLLEINLGRNIREGAHYTQFMVYDLDGDGRSEVVCKTADGTVDGRGTVIGDAAADHRSERGHILKGPEFLTVFDGLTGAALATVPYVPPRYQDTLEPTPEQLRAVWGDGRGNRSDRFLACVAYLDGERPSVVMCRGYYTRAVLAAWDWRDGKLTQRWVFDSAAGPEANRAFAGQGNHNLSVADVDGDGRDEIVYGACVIDDDGTGLYSTGWGHGDALHVTDHVPSNPGLEVFDIQERFSGEGMSMRDAATGRPIFLIPSVKPTEDGGDKGEGPGRGLAVNIDPRFPGSECLAIGAGMTDVFSATGERLFARPTELPANFAIWWDGDLLRELLDQNRIVKWNWEAERVDTLLTAHACISSNGTKATPVLSADLWGDWREEVVWRTRDGKELRIYTTTISTPHRLVTLMHDSHYRLSVAWQNVAYNQPPHTSFYLDEAAPLPARPDIRVTPRNN